MADTSSDHSSPPPYLPPPPQPERSAFEDRVGVHAFAPKSTVYGYLPQINQWAQQVVRKPLQWHVVRAGGQDHIPDFEATPECMPDFLSAPVSSRVVLQ